MIEADWIKLTEEQKIAEVRDKLEELYQIEHKTHPLTGKPEQGQLSHKKKELEQFVLNTLAWEK